MLEAEGGGPLPPLLLLHGFSSAGVHLLPMLGKLRRHVRRIILPDMPAHGFSDTPEPVTAQAMRRGVVEALDAVVTEPTVLFGNSMGGSGVIHYTLRRPDRVAGLVLCSPSGATMTAEEIAAFLLTFQVKTHGEALAFFDKVLHQPSRIRQIVAWELRRKFSRPALAALLSSLTPADCFQAEQLRTLKPPVLLIWGESERILPAAQLAFFRANLPPGSQVLTPRGFGHSPYLEAPGALAELILGFMRGIAPASAREEARAALEGEDIDKGAAEPVG